MVAAAAASSTPAKRAGGLQALLDARAAVPAELVERIDRAAAALGESRTAAMRQLLAVAWPEPPHACGPSAA